MHKLAIEYHIQIWQVSPQLSSAAVTPDDKYECEWKNLRRTFIRSKILLMEKLMNGVLGYSKIYITFHIKLT